MPKRRRLKLELLTGKKRRDYIRKLYAKAQLRKIEKKLNPKYTVRVFNKTGVPLKIDLIRAFFLGTKHNITLRGFRDKRKKYNSDYFVIDIPVFLRRMKREMGFRHAVLQLYEIFTFHELSTFDKSQIMILLKETKTILKKSLRKK